MPEYQIYAHLLKPDGTIEPKEQHVAGPFWDHRVAEDAVTALLSTGKWIDVQIK